MAARANLRRIVACAGAASALSGAATARAEQFVVAEATYTHSAQTTKDSHYFVEPTAETPPNWASPVDYANGSVHVRLEVKTKPSDAPTRYQICFEMKQNYCCTNQAPAYTTTGVYEWDTDVVDLWRPGPVDFTQGIVRNALILKDTTNVKPAPENVGEETSKLYMPSDLGVTVTVVSAGAEFMPPDEPMPMGGSGGGGSGGAAGAATAGSGGVPVTGGSAGESAGTAAIPPEPTAGTGASVPMTPAAGSAGAAGASSAAMASGDEGSCSLLGRRPASGIGMWAAFMALGLFGWRRRAAR